MAMTPEILADIQGLLDVAERHRATLGAVVSQTYDVSPDGNAFVIPGHERAFDRAFAACLVKEGGSVAKCAAIVRIRANAEAWQIFRDQLAAIAGNASKWPAIAGRLASPLGSC